MKRLFKFSLLLLAGILFIGCAGKEGAPGPTGSTGATGTTGATGQQGAVVKTYVFSGTFSPTVKKVTYNGLVGLANVNDGVFVYFLNETVSGIDYYVPLPMTLPVGTNSVVMYQSLGSDGSISIETDKFDGTSGSPWTVSYPVIFKVLWIKNFPSARVAAVDYNNYEEVKAYYNLKD